MHAVHTRQSLMTRIVESERRATLTQDQPRGPQRRQPTFSERYRGTEFEAPRTAAWEAQPPSVSRGRAFVLVAGASAVSLCLVVVAAALSA